MKDTEVLGVAEGWFKVVVGVLPQGKRLHVAVNSWLLFQEPREADKVSKSSWGPKPQALCLNPTTLNPKP